MFVFLALWAREEQLTKTKAFLNFWFSEIYEQYLFSSLSSSFQQGNNCPVTVLWCQYHAPYIKCTIDTSHVSASNVYHYLKHLCALLQTNTHSFSFPSCHHSIIPPFHHHKGAVPWNSEWIFLSHSTKSIQSQKNSLELFVRGQSSPQPTKTHSHEQRALIHMTSLGLAELILRPVINTIPEELWRRFRILCNDSNCLCETTKTGAPPWISCGCVLLVWT